MTTKPCTACGKGVYPLEQISAGAKIYHKICFKCEVCKITLNLKNSQEKGGQLYCNQHVPKEAPTATADRHDLNTIKAVPKIKTVNEQFRGEIVGQKSLEGTDSMGIGTRMNAPKVGVVNEQLRGELVGQKSTEGTDSLIIQNKLNAPKVAVVNEQVRGELAGQKPNVDLEASHIKNALAAPKRDVVNEQVRGELAGQKPSLDLNSLGINQALQAPKVEQNLGVKKTELDQVQGEVFHCS